MCATAAFDNAGVNNVFKHASSPVTLQVHFLPTLTYSSSLQGVVSQTLFKGLVLKYIPRSFLFSPKWSQRPPYAI